MSDQDEIVELRARAERAEEQLKLVGEDYRVKLVAAEAAAGQLRAWVELVVNNPGMFAPDCHWHHAGTPCNGECLWSKRPRGDAGRGWVSPEAHAAVVAERDRLNTELGLAKRDLDNMASAAQLECTMRHNAEAERDEARKDAQAAQVVTMDLRTRVSSSTYADVEKELLRLRRWLCMASEERVMEYLLSICNNRDDDGNFFAIRFGSQEKIGERLFSCRETVSRALGKFERQKLLTRKRVGVETVRITVTPAFIEKARSAVNRADVALELGLNSRPYFGAQK